MKKIILAYFLILLGVISSFTYIISASAGADDVITSSDGAVLSSDGTFLDSDGAIADQYELQTFFSAYTAYDFNTKLPHSASEIYNAKYQIKMFKKVFNTKTYLPLVDVNKDKKISGKDLALLKRSSIPKLPFYGIDVSYYQGDINWSEVRPYINFAILRAGFGKDQVDINPKDGIRDQIDRQFERNVVETERLEIPKGVYWFSYATTTADARAEAEFCLDVIKGHKYEFPIFFDIEHESHVKLSSAQCTAITNAFIGVLERAGYAAGVCSYKNFFENEMDNPAAFDFVWVAHYTGSVASPTSYRYHYEIWQFYNKGSIPGIVGDVDLNVCYENFPLYMKQNHLNGY
ncbi:hypothetical protein FACS1894132_00840 [Clostridia bacterium]|nr:hypothetical protein FACS1894132_00840 [Clostridia bacterium]